MTEFKINENGKLNELSFDSTDPDFVLRGNANAVPYLEINAEADGEIYSMCASQYFYEPKEDITAYELALIFGLGWVFYEYAIEALPYEAKRHFRKAD